jgi:hypothetical protein
MYIEKSLGILFYGGISQFSNIISHILKYQAILIIFWKLVDSCSCVGLWKVDWLINLFLLEIWPRY